MFTLKLVRLTTEISVKSSAKADETSFYRFMNLSLIFKNIYLKIRSVQICIVIRHKIYKRIFHFFLMLLRKKWKIFFSNFSGVLRIYV